MTLVLALLLAACQQDLILDANIPAPDPELVVNTLFGPDSLWGVYVNTTVPLLGTDRPEGVTTARVEILGDGQVIDVLPFEGLFQLDALPFTFADSSADRRGTVALYRSQAQRPAVGAAYSIRVSAPGFATVTGAGFIPEPVPIVTSSFRENVGTDAVGALDEVRLTFDDPPGEANYYNLRVQHRGLETTSNFAISVSYGFTVISDLQDDFFGADPDDILGDDDLFEIKEDGVTFNDAFFNGQRKEIVLHVRGGGVCGFTIQPLDDFVCQTVIELSTVTEAFYRYHRTLQLQNETAENPFAEPVRIYSNMDNGLGIFAGYNTTLWIHERGFRVPGSGFSVPHE